MTDRYRCGASAHNPLENEQHPGLPFFVPFPGLTLELAHWRRESSMAMLFDLGLVQTDIY